MKIFFPIETAVANRSEAMGAGDHFKSGASLKSQMSRGNISESVKEADVN